MMARDNYTSVTEHNVPTSEYLQKAYRMQPALEYLRHTNALKGLQVGKYKHPCSSIQVHKGLALPTSQHWSPPCPRAFSHGLAEGQSHTLKPHTQVPNMYFYLTVMPKCIN